MSASAAFMGILGIAASFFSHEVLALIGGIYNRPLAFGNMLHFTVVAITLVKVALACEQAALWVFTTLYLVFSVWFGADQRHVLFPRDHHTRM